MAGKISKEDAGYTMGQENCAVCEHFQENAKNDSGKCELVEGVIEESMWCRLFRRPRSPTLAEGPY